MPFQGNKLVVEGLRGLQRLLPSGWSVREIVREAGPLDVLAEITAPDRRKGSLAIEARSRFDPKRVQYLVEATRGLHEALLVVAPYLGESTRAHLREAGINYLDLTGNVRIVVSEPGLYVQTQGASEDPDREERSVRSLRGPKAGRIVRALIDHKKPPGVRELAVLTRIDAGYVSRVLAFLDREALLTRIGRGRLNTVDWPALLRRWAQDAPLGSRGEVRTYLDARGISVFVARLAKFSEQYVITGELAAAAFAPATPARLATLWIRDAAAAATKLGLRPAEAGTNILLVEPGDVGVFEGAVQRDGLWYAAPSQIAADLLTSPGRGPAEGEALITWMQANEEVWRR